MSFAPLYLTLTFLGSPILIVGFIGIRGLLRSDRVEQSFVRTAIMGCGWQFLWALPASIFPMAFMDGYFPAGGLFAWLLQVGGLSAATAFQSTREFHVQNVVVNALFFLGLLAIQVTVVSCVFAVRFRAVRRLSDPLCFFLGQFVLLNALMKQNWNWWGI